MGLLFKTRIPNSHKFKNYNPLGYGIRFFFVNDVPSIHLIYTFPLGILLAFAGIRFGIRADPMTVLFISVIIWSFVLMGLSDYFGTFA